MISLLERITLALGRLWIPMVVESVLRSPRGRDLIVQTLTSAIVGGMKNDPAADIVSRLMEHMIMDPANTAEDQSDVLPVYDLLSSLGVPVYGPIIEEER